jgi:ribulose-5-phosphate 4-epimerase/fuculose-1-phosphate aldolase
MGNYEVEKSEIVTSCRKLVEKGFLMATGGNVSVRIRANQPGTPAFAITPSNYDYLKMTPDDVCVLDFNLKQLEGNLKPSVEAAMHAAIFQTRADINAIIHTHQVYASALTLIKAPIPGLFDEQVRFLGRSVEIIPYAPSGTNMLRDTIARHVRNHNNAYLMQNHGALLFGGDMERAMHNVEVLEKCSLAYLISLTTGRKIHKIPLAVREVAFSKLRKDQRKLERGETVHAGE